MRSRKTSATATVLIALAGVGVAAPFVFGYYYIDVLTMLFINFILVTSFRLVTLTGGWNLAQVPLMGAGAYASALITGSLGWPFWLSLPLSAMAAALVGLIMSYPLARTRGFAFFIASYAAGEAMVLCWTRFKIPFGGWTGLTNVPPPGDLGGISFANPTPYYFLTGIIMAVCLWLMYRLGRSRIGSTFHVIHSQESLAKSIGINTIRYKMLVFVVGAFFAGVAGVLLVHRMWAVEPNQFGFVPILYLLVWTVFGGTRTFVGPILGVAVLTLVSELLVPLAEWVPMIYGFILILTLLFFPDGLEGIPHRVQSLYRKMQAGSNASEDLLTEGDH